MVTATWTPYWSVIPGNGPNAARIWFGVAFQASAAVVASVLVAGRGW